LEGVLSIHTKTNPYYAYLRERQLLNKAGSSKETYHLVLEVDCSQIPFNVGDSVAIFPENDLSTINDIIRKISGESCREFLLRKANICKCTSALLKLLQERGGGQDITALLEDKPRLLEFLQSHHLIDILKAFPNARPSPQELCEKLLPLMPRFYSIASSPKMFPQEIHLTVASLTYPTVHGPRRGVGSHFLCHHANEKTPIPLYVQPSNGFTIPSDPDAPMILIGPGTGVAPFRAFLQERMALRHKGANWLFFGERNRASDFYYEDYWLELEKQGRLRLDIAFSRDTAEKTYVQHKMWEQRMSIWEWIQNGAYIYVCGDASKMAKDVDSTLQRIGCDQGRMIEEDARLWLKALRKERKYLQDVY
jgi:sulfite reductase (NADPH) flavoprotein alpha-component